MKLVDIMMEIAHIENGLAYGEIHFELDKLGMVLGHHPADILDVIFGKIGDSIYFKGEDTVSKEELEDLLKNLKNFKSEYHVLEMAKPIRHLDDYLHPKREYTFIINLENGDESFILYEITSPQARNIQKAMAEGISFSEASGLKTLYDKVKKAAKNKLNEDLGLTNEINYEVNFGEEIKEDETDD